MKTFFRNKKILVLGAAGTVGREIVRQINFFEPAELRLMDNNESEMFFLMEEYKNKNVFCFLGDIRDRDKLEKLSKDIDIIIHCAAFKHVILSEYNPFDVVQTNIIGVENTIRAATAGRELYPLCKIIPRKKRTTHLYKMCLKVVTQVSPCSHLFLREKTIDTPTINVKKGCIRSQKCIPCHSACKNCEASLLKKVF